MMTVKIPKKIATDVGIATYNNVARRYYANIRGRRVSLAKKVYLRCHGKGSIPKGYEIHHVDGDKFNNHISNLIVVSHEDHLKLHNGQRKRVYDFEVFPNEIREEDPVVVLTFNGGKK